MTIRVPADPVTFTGTQRAVPLSDVRAAASEDVAARSTTMLPLTRILCHDGPTGEASERGRSD